jgi:hypothetical protein
MFLVMGTKKKDVRYQFFSNNNFKVDLGGDDNKILLLVFAVVSICATILIAIFK